MQRKVNKSWNHIRMLTDILKGGRLYQTSCFRTISSSSIPKEETRKTTVLLLHHGQPRTYFYAKQFLARSACDYYKLPVSITKLFIDLLWPLSRRVQASVADCEHSEPFQDNMKRISESLESALNTLLPEFSRFACSYASLYDEPTIDTTIKKITREGTDQLVLLPLYPHYSCFYTGMLLNHAINQICKRTNHFVDDTDDIFSTRIVPMSPVSFKVTAVDRWSGHPVMSNMWYQKLHHEMDKYDSILFVAPQRTGYGGRDYRREVWATCQQIIEHLRNCVPWRIAWFGGWDSWPAFTFESIRIQLFFLRKNGKNKTLVVPVTSPFPSYDTETVLPNLICDQSVDLVYPSSKSPVLIHGLAEIIKNHLLLGRPTSAQFLTHCKFCMSGMCDQTRAVLRPSSTNEKADSSVFGEPFVTKNETQGYNHREKDKSAGGTLFS
ncbi:hypothetical protein AB6A40_000504 [Gnathostoma spinigerum]|uniref:Ferrochelatase n=1 Tax=Gnathostoma spinigerum TaxID=75299 RepID=A0ABD6E360_9BILA